MKTLSFTIVVAVILCLYSLQPTYSQQSQVQPARSLSHQVVTMANLIFSQLQTTRYSHRTVVDEQIGSYLVDCSGLVCHILKKTAPDSLAEVAVDENHQRARAKNFYEAFKNASPTGGTSGWQRIKKLMDAEPGDLIAWKKEPAPQKGNTGHVVILLERPVLEDDTTVRALVLDSACSGHAQDSRAKGETGVGRGYIWFRVDKMGTPVAVHWSDRRRKPSKYPIVIGRAVGRATSSL